MEQVKEKNKVEIS